MNEQDPGSTSWTLLRKINHDTVEGRRAFAQVCATYWHYIRRLSLRRGRGPVQAEDDAQNCLYGVQRLRSLERLDPNGGRFRSFLIAVVKNVIGESNRSNLTDMRGGGAHHTSIDSFEFVDLGLSPEQQCERKAATEMLRRCVALLRADYARKGLLDWFDALAPCLLSSGPSNATLARRLGKSAGAVQQDKGRVREQYCATLRKELSRSGETEPNLTKVMEEVRMAWRSC